MSDFKPIVSSNLEAASYEAATKTLIVLFRGGSQYKYSNVLAKLYADFERTFDGKDGNSAGRFFHEKIRHLSNEKIEA